MRAERLSRPYAPCSRVTAYTVHSRIKKPTARTSTKYARIRIPRQLRMLPCRISRGNRLGPGPASWTSYPNSFAGVGGRFRGCWIRSDRAALQRQSGAEKNNTEHDFEVAPSKKSDLECWLKVARTGGNHEHNRSSFSA